MADGFDDAAAENVRALSTAAPHSCTVRSGMAEAWPLHYAFKFSAPQAVKDSLRAATPVDAFGNPKRREAGTWGASKSSGGDIAKLRRETRTAATVRYLVCQGGASTPASPLFAEEEAARAKESELEARLAAGRAELEGAIDAPNVILVLGSVAFNMARDTMGRDTNAGVRPPAGDKALAVQTAEAVRRALCKAKELNLECGGTRRARSATPKARIAKPFTYRASSLGVRTGCRVAWMRRRACDGSASRRVRMTCPMTTRATTRPGRQSRSRMMRSGGSCMYRNVLSPWPCLQRVAPSKDKTQA